MGYNSIAWLPLAAGLTILGLILSYTAYKRRGLRPAMLGTAWSLLPIAAYLTGAFEMLWKVGAAIGQFGSGFVFSPTKWAGVGVTGLAIALFLAAGGRSRRRAAREARKAARAGRGSETRGTPSAPGLARPKPGTRVLPARDREQVPAEPPAAAAPGRASRKAKAGTSHGGQQADDDDMKDIEDILRKRGL